MVWHAVQGDKLPPFRYVHHREETPLKNELSGERAVGLLPEFAEVLGTYIRVNRPEYHDGSGRRPLFVTEESRGRASKSTVRWRYSLISQPCRHGECPHDRDPEDCEATEHGLEARCPSSVKSHVIRTGAITHHLDQGWSETDLGARVNASAEVIDTHHDWPHEIRRIESGWSLFDALVEDSE
jgi:hypothetical protein